MPGHGGVVVLVLLLWLVPAALVFVHANNRGADAVLWTVVALVAGLVGVLLYLFLGGHDVRGQRRHPQSGSPTGAGPPPNQGGWNTSQQPTGQPAHDRQRSAQSGPESNQRRTPGASGGGTQECPHCYAKNSAQANYCDQCGTALRPD